MHVRDYDKARSGWNLEVHLKFPVEGIGTLMGGYALAEQYP